MGHCPERLLVNLHSKRSRQKRNGGLGPAGNDWRLGDILSKARLRRGVFPCPQNPFWEKTGLKKDDVLIAIDQKPINELFEQMQKGKPPFEILFLRGEQLIRLRIKVK